MSQRLKERTQSTQRSGHDERGYRRISTGSEPSCAGGCFDFSKSTDKNRSCLPEKSIGLFRRAEVKGPRYLFTRS